MPTQENNVSNEVLDSILEANMILQASAPTVSSAMTFQSLAHAVSVAMQNATANQQKVNMLTTAVTSNCVELIMGNVNAQSSTSTTTKTSTKK